MVPVCSATHYPKEKEVSNIPPSVHPSGRTACKSALILAQHL